MGKISNRPIAGVLNGAEPIPVVKDGVTKRTNAAAIASLGQAVGMEGAAVIANLLDAFAEDDGTLQGVKQSEYVNAPALNLNRWMNGNVANLMQCALPANFNHLTDDAWQYAQNLIADMEAIGDRRVMEVPGGNIYRFSDQLVFGDGKASGIRGVGGRPILHYIGPALNPVTQDNGDGAFLHFAGNDHAWGGAKNLILFCSKGVVHGAYVRGDITPGFKLDDIHVQHALLDGILVDYIGTASPVCQIIRNLTAYPFTDFGGIPAVCGRSVLHARINNSVGTFTVRDFNCDNGVEAGVLITAPVENGFAGINFLFENTRFEQNRENGDLVVLDYAASASKVGSINFINPMHAVANDGSTTNFIRNKSATARRPNITFDSFATNNAVVNVYKDDLDDGKTIPYIAAEYLDKQFRIEHSVDQNLGTFPCITRPTGPRPVVALPASVAIGRHEHGKTFTSNGAGGPTTYTLPDIDTVCDGFEAHFISTTGFAITVDGNGGDVVGGLGSLTSSAARDAISLKKGVVGPNAEWLVTAKVGVWA